MEHTELAGERFLFHGTGGELFTGALKAIGLLLGIAIVPVALALSMGGTLGRVFGALLFYAALFALAPLVIVGARKYRCSRTSYRNIRFSFRGTVGECAGVFYPGALLTVVTLGVYLPFLLNNMARFTYSNTWYGTVKLEYDGEGSEFFPAFLLCALLVPFTLGLSLNWWWAAKEQHYRKHTSILGARLNSAVDGGGLLFLNVTNVLLVVFTLGIGWSWAVTRRLRYYLDNLSVQGPLDLDAVRQQALGVDTTGEGLSLVLEADAGFFDLAF